MTEHDDLLNDLDAALKVAPSSNFADGVRARVQKSRTRTTQMWLGLAAAATVGFAMLMLWRPTVEVPVQLATTAPVEAPVVATAPTHATRSPEPAATPVRSAQTARRPMATVVRVAAHAESEPRLEVITNQGAVLRELWAVMGARRVPLVETDATTASSQLDTTGIVVDPLVVQPIVVREFGKEPTSGGNPIIRRAYATKETR